MSTRTQQTHQTKQTHRTNQPYYLKGSALTTRLNSVIGWLARHGVNPMGLTELSVRGRKSGVMQRIPVNAHTFEGTRYLVSARGHSQWVRNMRAAGGGEFRTGRRTQAFTATEIPDDEKPGILLSYLERWGWEVNQYFQGVTAKSSHEELVAACPDHPVFRITMVG